MKKKNVSINLDVEVIEALKKKAEELDRSISWTVNEAIKKYLKG